MNDQDNVLHLSSLDSIITLWFWIRGWQLSLFRQDERQLRSFLGSFWASIAVHFHLCHSNFQDQGWKIETKSMTCFLNFRFIWTADAFAICLSTSDLVGLSFYRYKNKKQTNGLSRVAQSEQLRYCTSCSCDWFEANSVELLLLLIIE